MREEALLLLVSSYYSYMHGDSKSGQSVNQGPDQIMNRFLLSIAGLAGLLLGPQRRRSSRFLDGCQARPGSTV